jgi:homoserine dehydrogenase
VLPSDRLVDRLEPVLADAGTQVAVHLVGGLEPARTILLRLLEAGKDVVTANKAVLCEYGPELFARARALGRTICFEAAVAGGIPILKTVGEALAANQILALSAILNGTSNFILTEMTQRQQTYADALRSAQALGYAEADPTLDVDGTDAAQKLVILTQLAFGTRVTLDQFSRQGIDGLDPSDILYAGELGYTVKLLADARLSGERLELHVAPTLVRHHAPLAKVDGPFNAIMVRGDIVGETFYSGRGAGRMPTASAVLADLLDLAVGRAALTFQRLPLWRPEATVPLLPAGEICTRYYLRFNILDRPGVLAEIAEILGRHRISIASVIQHEAPEVDEAAAPSPFVPLVIMTHRSTAGGLAAASIELNRLASLRPPLVQLAVADDAG